MRELKTRSGFPQIRAQEYTYIAPFTLIAKFDHPPNDSSLSVMTTKWPLHIKRKEKKRKEKKKNSIDVSPPFPPFLCTGISLCFIIISSYISHASHESEENAGSGDIFTVSLFPAISFCHAYC